MTDDLRFDELLREDAAALPPPADGEITPWRTAMDRILWGMGLTTITLNFLWLDVLLPAIGAVLLVLGFRTLRRENAPLRWGYRLALLALAIRFAGDVLAALPVDVGNAPAYVHIPVTLALYVCLWRGMVGVSRAAGAEKPAAPAAGAMAVFYAALTALALIGLEGWLLVLPLLALYLFLLRSMVRLSRSLTDTGYAITAAPVRLSDSAVLWSALGALLAAVLLCAEGPGSIEDVIFERRFGCAAGFAALGGRVRVEGRTLYAEPGGTLQGTVLEAPDLRGGAALVIAALAAQGSSRITHTEFIDRGYADFAQKLTALGGQIARETPHGADCPKKRTSKT